MRLETALGARRPGPGKVLGRGELGLAHGVRALTSLSPQNGLGSGDPWRLEGQKKEPTLVVPVLFYHGREKWSSPVSFLDTFKLPEKAKELLKENVLNFSYCIFDLNLRRYGKMELSSSMQGSLFALHHYYHVRQEEYLREFGRRVGKFSCPSSQSPR